MLRALFIALVLALLPARAHAQSEPVGRPDLPGVAEVANVIIQATPIIHDRERGLRWDAMSIRISRFTHWHIYEPDPRDRAPDAVVRRNGWIEGADVEVSVFGNDDRVTQLTFEYERFNALDLLSGLRAAGAGASLQADYESYSEYVITPSGRETALLTLRRTCTPPGSRRAPHCQDSAELTFAFE